METSQSTNQDPVDLNLSNEFTSLSITSTSHVDRAKSQRVSEAVEADGEVAEGPNHHSLWGFDEMFFGCSKMYISDVLSMTKSSQYPGDLLINIEFATAVSKFKYIQYSILFSQ